MMFNRVVHFALITPTSPQHGLRDALRGIANHHDEIDWHSRYERKQFRQINMELTAKGRALGRGDLLFIQCQTRGIIAPIALRQIRAIKVDWCGDLRDTINQHQREVAPFVDVVLASNRRDVETLRKMRQKSDFLQVGFSHRQFNPLGRTLHGSTPPIVAMLNNYQKFPQSKFRADMVAGLRARYGSQFAVYGNGWGADSRWLNEDDEAATYRACKIAVGAENYAGVDGFMSDRSLRATGCGACYLPHRFVAFDEHFVDGKEAVAWNTLEELYAKIDYLLDHDNERQAIGAAGAKRTHKTHSWDARMVDLQRLIEQYAGVVA